MTILYDLTLTNKQSRFEELLEKDSSVSIHQKIYKR